MNSYLWWASIIYSYPPVCSCWMKNEIITCSFIASVRRVHRLNAWSEYQVYKWNGSTNTLAGTYALYFCWWKMSRRPYYEQLVPKRLVTGFQCQSSSRMTGVHAGCQFCDRRRRHVRRECYLCKDGTHCLYEGVPCLYTHQMFTFKVLCKLTRSVGADRRIYISCQATCSVGTVGLTNIFSSWYWPVCVGSVSKVCSVRDLGLKLASHGSYGPHQLIYSLERRVLGLGDFDDDIQCGIR